MLKPQPAVRAPCARPLAETIPISIRAKLPVPRPSHLQSPVSFGKLLPQRRVARLVAAQSGPAGPSSENDTSINIKKGFWTFVDVVAILGSVGGALAAILNLFTGTYVLFLPLVLPVVSLLAALQREGLIAEDNRRAYDTLRNSLARDSSAMLADARAAIEEVRRELKGQNTTAARLGTIEARLSSLEGSILSAGRSAREAAAGLGVLPERLQAEQRVALDGLVAAMRLELRRAAESLANNETTALARLDARLAAVEGSLSGLEVAQSEGLRRLSMSLNSALADAEATLQSSVRNEVARSMEPVRRLPQMLAAALPPALAAAEAVEASLGGGVGVGGPVIGPAGVGGLVAGVAGVPAVSPEQMQAIVGQEVEGAVGRILAFQADAFGRLNTVRPVPLDEEQWSALGRRLTRLERLVEGVPTGTEGALLQGGQLAAAVAAAVREAVAAQLVEARAETAAAASCEADGLRNDVLAVQTLMREQFDGLAAALQPLQLGITELQVAVAAAAEQQRQAQAQSAALAAQQAAAMVALAEAEAQAQAMARRQQESEVGEMGSGQDVGPSSLPAAAMAAVTAAAATPPPPPPDLARLLEGVAAVAALLRDVDAKMDAVAATVAQLPQDVAAAAAASQPQPQPQQEAPASGDAALSASTQAAEAAADVQRQQQDLKEGIESMRETLATLAAQVGALLASGPEAVTRAAAASAASVPCAEAVATAPEALPAPPAGASQPPSTLSATSPSSSVSSSSSSSSFVAAGSGAPAVADVLAFEASLASTSLAEDTEPSSSRSWGAAGAAAGSAPPPAADVSADSRGPPATAGASRDEAYDMMLQLAEARRRSGSEASASGRTEGGSSSAAALWSSRGNGDRGDGGSESSTTAREGPQGSESHLQIDGLPPFQGQEQPQGSRSSTLSAADSELPLPPLQSELAEAAPISQVVEWLPAPQAFEDTRPQSPPSPPAASQQPQQSSWSPESADAAILVQSASPGMYGSVAPGPGSVVQDEGTMPAEGYGVGLPYNASAVPVVSALEGQAQQPPYAQPHQQLQQQALPFVSYDTPIEDSSPADVSYTAAAESGWSGLPAAGPAAIGPQSPERPGPYWAGPADVTSTSPVAPAPPVAYPPAAAEFGAPGGQVSPAAATVARPASSNWSPPPPAQAASVGPSPVMDPITPSGLADAAMAAAPAPSVVTSAPPSPPSTPPLSEYRMRPLEGLSSNEVISEGLRLLRLGREETRKGEDFGLADELIQQSIGAFTTAASMAPADTKALGNLGNALLARGELKAAYLEALRSGPPPATYEEVEAQRCAEMAMTSEANMLLTQAGVQFMKVLEMDGWSSRALVNWGRALVIRADLLAACPDAAGGGALAAGASGGGGSGPGVTTVVAQLYTAAINKFEGVLEGEPDMVPAKYRCALAMAGLSRTRAPGSREAITLLVDAINYLRDVIASPSPDAEALRSSAAVALQQYEGQLMAQRATRRV